MDAFHVSVAMLELSPVVPHPTPVPGRSPLSISGCLPLHVTYPGDSTYLPRLLRIAQPKAPCARTQVDESSIQEDGVGPSFELTVAQLSEAAGLDRDAHPLSALVAHYRGLEASNFAAYNACNAANEEISELQRKARALERSMHATLHTKMSLSCSAEAGRGKFVHVAGGEGVGQKIDSCRMRKCQSVGDSDGDGDGDIVWRAVPPGAKDSSSFFIASS
eukprot:356176-Chlamydomonas_euryale.AAC.3